MTSKVFIKKIKENLLNEKRELLTRAAREQNLDVDIDLDGDETDEIQGKMLIELHNTLNGRSAAKIIAIDNALKRIDEKSYGHCEECGEEIPEKRLLANPHFQTCVGCAEDKEKEERQRRRA